MNDFWKYALILMLIGNAVLCGWLASEKNRNPVKWFFLGLIFNIFAIITLSGAPSKEPDKIESQVVQPDANTEKPPFSPAE